MFDTASEPLKLKKFAKGITTSKTIFRLNRHINYKTHLYHKQI